MNRATLIGRVGNDAETKQFDNGNVAVRFSLATSESWKGADGQKHEETQWHRCTGWGDRFAKLAQWITKGRLLMVEGKIKYREADGKQYTDIEVKDIEFLSSGDKAQPKQQPAVQPQAAPMQEGGLGDLPF